MELETKTLNTQSSSMNISTDLILEILSRASAKTIVRFRRTSKLWSSILNGPYFTELFLTRSSARPRLLFILEGADEWRFFSIPQPQNPHQKPSLIVTADFHMKFPGVMSQYTYIGAPISGLICLPNMRFLDKDKKNSLPVPVICNPSTGQYMRLPKARKNRDFFLGFDPIDKEFKVLSVPNRTHDDAYELHIMTLGAENVMWRKIHCPFAHYGRTERICIDGVLYYFAYPWIVCFDVRSEKFKFIEDQCFFFHGDTKFVNYKGKLGSFRSDYHDTVLTLFMWVLEDVEKQTWSNNVYTFQENKLFERVGYYYVSFVGVTTTGEIVMTLGCISKPFYVLYFSPERKTLQSIEIQILGANHEAYDEKFSRDYTFLDYVEDLKFL